MKEDIMFNQRVTSEIRELKEESKATLSEALISKIKRNDRKYMSALFENGDQRIDKVSNSSQKKVVHKNMLLLAFDDMNIGEEVTYAISEAKGDHRDHAKD